MPGLSDILGGIGDAAGGLLGEGSIARQFLVWGVLQSIASEAISPFLQALHNDLQAKSPEVPISPATLADAVLRGVVGLPWAEGEAAKSGVSAGDFGVLVTNTGEPPAVGELLSLWRRGEIDDAALEKGVKQSRVRDEWLDTIKKMGIIPPTPNEALNALLKGQIPRAEAETRYQQGGGDPTWFQAAFDSNGSAPTPLEAAEMANRGAIPWEGTGPGVVSFHQAFLEGPWRDKWLTPYRTLAEYVPPPRTITTLIHDGVLTDEQALTLFRKQGMTPEIAAAYLASAHHVKTTAQKHLTITQITELYADRAITQDDAMKLLASEGYSTEDAQFLLQLADHQRDRKYHELSISRVHSLYVGHKIDRQTAVQTLAQLQVVSGQVTDLLASWDLERKSNIKIISEGQIVAAFFYDIITQDVAMTRLQQIGYQPHDAWILLSVRVHSPIPGEPPVNAIATID